jgi:hypothetical protein
MYNGCPAPADLKEWLRWLAVKIEDIPEFGSLKVNGNSSGSGNTVKASSD